MAWKRSRNSSFGGIGLFIGVDGVLLLTIYPNSKSFYYEQYRHSSSSGRNKSNFESPFFTFLPQTLQKKKQNSDTYGRSFLRCKKDKRHPFIVETEAIRVQVLGTLFNINAYKNNSCIETTLLEGSVAVGNREKTDCLILKPNEKAIYNKVGGRLIRKIAENSAIDIAWIHGELIFESTPLKEIIQELGNRFNVDIVIADTAIQNYRITARFPNEETLETILSVLHKAGYFDYTLNNGKIILTTNPTNQ